MAEKKKFDPTGMTPVMGVESQGEGEGSSQSQEGWMHKVGDKTYYYDLNGAFTGGFRDAGNGWTAKINQAGKDLGLAKNTSHSNDFGGLLSDTLSNPEFQQGIGTLVSIVNPAAGAVIKGLSRAGQDGDLGAGLLEGGKSYALAKGFEALTSPGVDELAGPPEPSYTGADPANPMQQDPATMRGQTYDSTGTPTTTHFTPDAPGTPTTDPSLGVKDLNTAVKTITKPGSTALDYLAKNSGIDKDLLELATLTGATKPLTDLANKVDKGVKDVIKPPTPAPTTAPKPGTGEQSGTTPYNIPPALLALIAGQLGQQQPQQPVQTPTVDLKSVGEFDPFGEFNYGSKNTAHAAQGGSISDLIRMLRS